MTTTHVNDIPSHIDFASTLIGMADHIEEVGLQKGRFFKDGSLTDLYVGGLNAVAEQPCCVLGAMHYVQMENRQGGAHHLEYALSDALGVGWAPRWNDAPETTQEDVVTALRKAAKELMPA